MFTSYSAKLTHLMSVVAILLLPILIAVPPEVVHAAPVEAMSSVAAEEVEPLTATVPLPAAAPESIQRSANLQETTYDNEPVYLLAGDKLWRTRNFMDASPQWEDITGTLPASSGQPFSDLYLDEQDPYNKAWISIYYTGIWYTENLDADEPTWVQKAAFNAFRVFEKLF